MDDIKITGFDMSKYIDLLDLGYKFIHKDGRKIWFLPFAIEENNGEYFLLGINSFPEEVVEELNKETIQISQSFGGKDKIKLLKD